MSSNAEIETHDIAIILNNMMDAVRNNLVLLSASLTYKINMWKIQKSYSLMHKELLVILLQATSGLTEMVSYYGPKHLIIGQYIFHFSEYTVGPYDY
jgi:hypothetical protein